MKSIITKLGVLTAMFVVCAAGAAQAGTIEVTVPFPFLVDGKTLPAGQYQLETDGTVVVIRGEHHNRASAMFIPAAPADGHDPSGDQPSLTFTRDETQYKLADIWESSSEGVAVAGR
jgi:hypothetical protein